MVRRRARAKSSQRPETGLITPDSRQAWVRLALALLIGSIGAVGMWAVVVVMPVVQTEFRATRGAVSLGPPMIFWLRLGGRRSTGRITDASASCRRWRSASLSRRVLCAGGLSTAAVAVHRCYFLIGLGTRRPSRR
jgi:hypothetical protein